MKAFDKIPNRRQLSKIRTFGFPEYIIAWLEDFLIARRQAVLVSGESAEETIIKSWILQGSVLGPLLFLLYV